MSYLQKGKKVIAEFGIIPIGTGGTSVGQYVAVAINAINRVKGVNCDVTSMGTLLEADDLQTIFDAVKAAHEALFEKGVLRVESTIRIDDRRDKPRTMADKVESVKRYMKSI